MRYFGLKTQTLWPFARLDYGFLDQAQVLLMISYNNGKKKDIYTSSKIRDAFPEKRMHSTLVTIWAKKPYICFSLTRIGCLYK